jgi:pimeloyl-ACP methyl ester carboxylesterase
MKKKASQESHYSGYFAFLTDFYYLIKAISQKFPAYFKHYTLRTSDNNHGPYNFHDDFHDDFPFYETHPGKTGTKNILTIEKQDLFNALEHTFDCKISNIDQGEKLSAIDSYFSALLEQSRHNRETGAGPVNRSPDLPVSIKDLETLNRKFLNTYNSWIKSQQEQAQHCQENMEKKTIKGPDGFNLTYFTAGNRENPPLILVNAYGMSHLLWKYVIAYFSRHYRVIIWVTRGCHEDDTDLVLDGIAQAADLAHIMNHERVNRADFICWCSGLKILLEYYRREPGRFKTISIINGYFEPLTGNPGPQTPFDNYIASLGKFVLLHTSAFLKQKNIPGILSKIFSFDFQKKVISHSNREESALEIALKILEMPPAEIKSFLVEPFLKQKKFLNYARLVLDLHKHNISNILPDIKAPVLVISSERDIITYPGSAKKALQKLKQAKHIFLKGASHWVLWDKFREVNPIILKHIKKNEKNVSLKDE